MAMLAVESAFGVLGIAAAFGGAFAHDLTAVLVQVLG
jgi:hypothetical protein